MVWESPSRNLFEPSEQLHLKLSGCLFDHFQRSASPYQRRHNHMWTLQHKHTDIIHKKCLWKCCSLPIKLYLCYVTSSWRLPIHTRYQQFHLHCLRTEGKLVAVLPNKDIYWPMSICVLLTITCPGKPASLTSSVSNNQSFSCHANHKLYFLRCVLIILKRSVCFGPLAVSQHLNLILDELSYQAWACQGFKRQLHSCRLTLSKMWVRCVQHKKHASTNLQPLCLGYRGSAVPVFQKRNPGLSFSLSLSLNWRASSHPLNQLHTSSSTSMQH